MFYIFWFLQRYKTPIFEENEKKYKIAINTFFSPIFFEECKKLKKRFTTEVKKTLIH